MEVSVAVVNACRVDFDRALNWSTLKGNVALSYEDNPSEEEFLARVPEDCVVVVTKEIAVPETVVDRLPASVRLICEAGTGFNNVALAACKRRGIAVANVPGYSRESVASLVLTLVLASSCGLVGQQRRIWGGDTGAFTTPQLGGPHFEVQGKVLGLVGGRGSIGSRVASMARAFGMHVIVSTRGGGAAGGGKGNTPPSVNTAAEAEAEEEEPYGSLEYTDSVDDLLRRSDFVSLHVPLTASTRHLMGAHALQLMKPSAVLINTARGGLVDEAALMHALDTGELAGACLDVQDPEPPVPDSPLWTHPRVVLTPHMGWKRLETRQRLVDAVAANIDRFLNGTPANIVS